MTAKVPASGKIVKITLPASEVRVTEGSSVDVGVKVTLPAGLATPRDDVLIPVDVTVGNTETADFTPNHAMQTAIARFDAWVDVPGGGLMQTALLNFTAVDDSEPESPEDIIAKLDTTDGHVAYNFPTADADRALTVWIDDDDMLVVTGVAMAATTKPVSTKGGKLTFEVTCNASVDVTGMPQFTFDLGGQSRLAMVTDEFE